MRVREINLYDILFKNDKMLKKIIFINTWWQVLLPKCGTNLAKGVTQGCMGK